LYRNLQYSAAVINSPFGMYPTSLSMMCFMPWLVRSLLIAFVFFTLSRTLQRAANSPA
jgi:hypothetical protein